MLSVQIVTEISLKGQVLNMLRNWWNLICNVARALACVFSSPEAPISFFEFYKTTRYFLLISLYVDASSPPAYA